MRRAGARPLAHALADAVRDAAPPTVLARVQACWADAVGAPMAAESSPVAERGGTLTVECRSALWAAELELLAPEILARLDAALGAPADPPVRSLRVRAAGTR